MSANTKKYKVLSLIFGALSFLCGFAPLFVYMIIGWNKVNDAGKYALSTAAIFCIVIVVINAVFKYHFRSFIWIFLIAVISVFKNAVSLITVFAVLQIVDEIIITPLYKKYRDKYKVNKEIDEREGITNEQTVEGQTE